MKVFSRGFSVWVLAAVCTAISIAAAAAPFLGSRSDPHATLYLDVANRPQDIYLVKMWAVDGKLSNRTDQGVLWVMPGDYTFTFRLRSTSHMLDAPGLLHDAGQKQDQPHDLKVSLETGKSYYIGAKLAASGQWEPVVWKTEDKQ